MTLYTFLRPFYLCLFLIAALSSSEAQTQGSPFTGFSDNPNKPINFEADKAEVFDGEKKAILSGNVKIIQGESTLLTAKLTMFYDGKESKAPVAQSSGPVQGQAVSKFFMDGGVTVKSKNQVAIADKGFFDAKLNIAELTGNVTLTQCNNVLKGDKLLANLKTNQATITSSGKGTRVSGMLVQGKPGDGEGCDGTTPPAKPAAAPKAKAGSKTL